jgi:hypothetical protein
MSTQQREAIDRFYRQSKIDASTPADLRAGFAETMAHFATADGTTATDTTLGGRRALRITPGALPPKTPIPPQVRTHSAPTANFSTTGSTREPLSSPGIQPAAGWRS